MDQFEKVTRADYWFKQHPEKIAGVEYESSFPRFPIMVRGTKEDVIKATGITPFSNAKKVDPDKARKLKLARARAIAKIKLSNHS